MNRALLATLVFVSVVVFVGIQAWVLRRWTAVGWTRRLARWLTFRRRLTMIRFRNTRSFSCVCTSDRFLFPGPCSCQEHLGRGPGRAVFVEFGSGDICGCDSLCAYDCANPGWARGSPCSTIGGWRWTWCRLTRGSSGRRSRERDSASIAVQGH